MRVLVSVGKFALALLVIVAGYGFMAAISIAFFGVDVIFLGLMGYFALCAVGVVISAGPNEFLRETWDYLRPSPF